MLTEELVQFFLPIVYFVLGALVTAVVNYFYQTRLQDRAERRKIAREIIKAIYGPLYVELQKIKDNLANGFEAIYRSDFDFGGEGKCKVWEKVKTHPEFFSIPLDLGRDLEDIVLKAEKINNLIEEIRTIVDPILLEEGRAIFDRSIEYRNVRHFTVIHKRKDVVVFSEPLHYFAILNVDPFEHLKERFYDFSPERSRVWIELIEAHEGGLPLDLPLDQIHGKLNQILKKARQRMIQIREVAQFLEEKHELSKKIEKVLPRVEKHIKKHYSITDM